MLLSNKKILITKSKEDIEGKILDLENLGAEITYFATIETSKIDASKNNLLETLNNNPDYIVFTSANAVKHFSELIDLQNISNFQSMVISIGRKTTAICKEMGIGVDFTTNESSTDGIINWFKSKNVRDCKIMIPTSDIADEKLKYKLELVGNKVDVLRIYTTTCKQHSMESVESILNSKFDLAIFTSPSSFDCFVKTVCLNDLSFAKNNLSNTTLCTIGTKTEMALREKDFVVNIVPSEFSLDGVYEAVINYYQKINFMV